MNWSSAFVRHDRSPYVYIILLTARNEKSDLVSGLDAGADDYLGKPFDRDELRARIRVGERIIHLHRELEDKNRTLLAAKERMEQDLAAAAKMQQALLPAQLPESSAAKFAWSFRPCEASAGDNLNVFRLDDDQIGFYVADVSGHGVAAALLSVTIHQILSPHRSEHSLVVQPDRCDASKCVVNSPQRVVSELNRRFPMEEFNGKYFTIVYGVLNTKTCELSYVSAGHPPIILISKTGHCRLLENTCVPVGWNKDLPTVEKTLRMNPGDRLCIYSDGITDAENGQNEEFGDARLLESLTSTVSLPINDSVAQAMLKIDAWRGTNALKDDLSMLAIEITD